MIQGECHVLAEGNPNGTVKLSKICPFCGRILLDQRLRINDLAVAAGGENAAKLLNLTVPSHVLTLIVPQHLLLPLDAPPEHILKRGVTFACLDVL